MAVTVNYSNNDLSTLKNQLNNFYSVLTCKSAKYVLYKTICPNIDLLKELFMYKFVIDDYVINNNTPDPNNFITAEELTCIIQKIKEITC